MPSNSFGNYFRFTTFGESHGKAIGVVIDGCPAGIELAEEDIDKDLARRAPGSGPYSSKRKEPDRVQILAGLFEGKTTGAPLALLIENRDVRSDHYAPIKDLLRPGHANFTYLEKYGIFDYRGGGRASARETAARVAAGAVAKKLLEPLSITCHAKVAEIGGKKEPNEIEKLLEEVVEAGDSVGGVIEAEISSLPTGLGDPLFEKIEARLAYAMLGLPAAKGFEMGEGFVLARMRASEANDLFIREGDQIKMASNRSGGTLGGITTGMPLRFRVAFKAASSIRKKQPTLTLEGFDATLELPEGSRHDPCLVFRALPVVEAMSALVIADALLAHRLSRT